MLSAHNRGGGNGRPLTILIWLLLMAALFFGQRLFRSSHSHSPDQQVLIDHSKQ